MGGGGARNAALMTGLADALPGTRVVTFEAHGLPSDAVEAVTFAALARQAVLGYPNSIPSATGARHAVVMGKIIPGFRGIPPARGSD